MFCIAIVVWNSIRIIFSFCINALTYIETQNKKEPIIISNILITSIILKLVV